MAVPRLTVTPAPALGYLAVVNGGGWERGPEIGKTKTLVRRADPKLNIVTPPARA